MNNYKIIFFILTIAFQGCLCKSHYEAKLYFTDYCTNFGYPSEKHDVITEDGYILTYFRVQAKYTYEIKEGLQPILLQHGLLDCSDTFIINEETKALAFVLANRGYDVWLGNNRGNKHSKRHQQYSTTNKLFWDFTFEEMAIYDLPAGFKYIQERTKQQIIYIGHSQGTIQMHAHLSMFKNEQESIVRKYLKQYIGLGPVAYVDHQNSVLVNLLLHSGLDKFLVDMGVQEFMAGDTWITTDVGRVFCSTFAGVCGDLIGSMISADPKLDNYDRYDVLAGHDPAGTSTKNLLYWKQLVENGRFERYDYGEIINKHIYGQVTPPLYDLSNIDIRVNLFAGFEDLLADPTDVYRLVASLVNSPQVWIKFYHAGHCSFMWGRDMPYYKDLWDVLEGIQ